MGLNTIKIQRQVGILQNVLKNYKRGIILKNQWCRKNNIPLKRIPYWELNNITINNIMDDTFLVT